MNSLMLLLLQEFSERKRHEDKAEVFTQRTAKKKGVKKKTPPTLVIDDAYRRLYFTLELAPTNQPSRWTSSERLARHCPSWAELNKISPDCKRFIIEYPSEVVVCLSHMIEMEIQGTLDDTLKDQEIATVIEVIRMASDYKIQALKDLATAFLSQAIAGSEDTKILDLCEPLFAEQPLIEAAAHNWMEAHPLEARDIVAQCLSSVGKSWMAKRLILATPVNALSADLERLKTRYCDCRHENADAFLRCHGNDLLTTGSVFGVAQCSDVPFWRRACLELLGKEAQIRKCRGCVRCGEVVTRGSLRQLELTPQQIKEEKMLWQLFDDCTHVDRDTFLLCYGKRMLETESVWDVANRVPCFGEHCESVDVGDLLEEPCQACKEADQKKHRVPQGRRRKERKEGGDSFSAEDKKNDLRTIGKLYEKCCHTSDSFIGCHGNLQLKTGTLSEVAKMDQRWKDHQVKAQEKPCSNCRKADCESLKE